MSTGGSFEQHEERSSRGALLYQAFFRPENDKSVFVLPGDCFPPEAYFPLAEHLCRAGANAFVIDYLAACEGNIPDRELRDEHCADAAVQIIQRIRGRFSPGRDGGADYLLGHSRGANVGIGVLGRTPVGGGLILHAPFIRWKHARYPLSLALVSEVGPQLLLRERVRLRFETFRRRFFGDTLPEADARRHYLQSRGIPRGLLLDKGEFNLDVLRGCRLFIYLYADDNALPVEAAMRTLRSLTKLLSLKLHVILIPGAHGELISSPHVCAEHVVELCLS
jgi:hypothetical protein